jgi:hypothetical protein
VSAAKEKDTGNVWVLDTETKGTGANMVPLERVLRKPGSSDAVPGFVFRKLEPPASGQAEPRAPHRFKVVDLMTREVLAEDVDARGAVRTLEAVRSIVDVSMFVWEPEAARWRLLTFDEGRLLWGYRGRVEELPGVATPAPAP